MNYFFDDLKMKILFITHYTNLHGSNKSLLNLINGLQEYNVESMVFTPNEGEVTRKLAEKNIPYHICSLDYWMWPEKAGRIKRMLSNLKSLPSLVKKMREWRSDVIYTNSSVTPVGAFLADLTGKPHVWHIREFGGLDYNLHPDWGKKFMDWWMSKADAVIANSKSIKKQVLEDVSTRKHVVYNGVVSRKKAELIKKQIKKPDLASPYRFAMLSQINKNKGQQVALKALKKVLKKHPDTRLTIAGRQPEDKRFEKLSHRLGICENTEFTGYLEDPFQLIHKSDAVLMCSRNEAMGRVTAEAMMCGKPVIGYDNAGTAELIDHEVNGLLYKDGFQDLAKEMKRLIENPLWGHLMGLKGREKSEKNFLEEQYAEKIHDIVKNTIDND